MCGSGGVCVFVCVCSAERDILSDKDGGMSHDLHRLSNAQGTHKRSVLNRVELSSCVKLDKQGGFSCAVLYSVVVSFSSFYKDGFIHQNALFRFQYPRADTSYRRRERGRYR